MATEDLDTATAALRLQTAVDELTQPGVVKLQRDIPQPGTTAWQLAADDRDLEHQLLADLAVAQQRGDQAGEQRAIDALHQLDARRDARTSTTAPVPSLLDQLLDEIPNSSNGDRGTGSGGSRSPLAVAALDAAQEIALAVGATVGAGLAAQVRRWAEDGQRFDELTAFRATKAEAWPDRVRNVLTPQKRWTAAGRCPDCGNREAWVPDDTGEPVRRPAIEFDRSRGTARCLRCPARWTTEAQLQQLAKVLTEEAG